MLAVLNLPTDVRRRFIAWTGSLFCWLSLAYGSVSRATPIEYAYTGVITSADTSTGVSPGASFSGTFTFDPTEKPSGNLGYEGFTQYAFGNADGYPSLAPPDLSGLSLQVGGTPVYTHTGGLNLSVSEIEYAGQYSYDPVTNPYGPNTKVIVSNNSLYDTPLSISLTLSNPSRSVFGSLAVPTSLNLADFPQAQMSVYQRVDLESKMLYSGTIESLSVVPPPTAPSPSMLLTHGYASVVPEPTSLTLFCIAAVSLVAHTLRGKVVRIRESSPS